VKSISPDLILLIIFVRNRIQIMRWLHALMESGIKHCHLRGARKKLFAGEDSCDIRRIMQRS
jgi:hypothetical protein